MDVALLWRVEDARTLLSSDAAALLFDLDALSIIRLLLGLHALTMHKTGARLKIHDNAHALTGHRSNHTGAQTSNAKGDLTYTGTHSLFTHASMTGLSAKEGTKHAL
jgi:hypothetical protein